MIRSLRLRFFGLIAVSLFVVGLASYLLILYPSHYGIAFFISGLILISFLLSGVFTRPFVEILRIIDLMKSGPTGSAPDSVPEELEGIVRAFMEIHEDNLRQIESHRRFTSDVAHEIRSPLTALRGSIEVALRRERSSAEYRDVLQRSLDEVKRLQGIAENLLLLSRADYKIIEMRKDWFDVNELVQDIVDRMRNLIGRKKILLSEEYQEPLEFFGDKGFIDQAITNVVDNAIKYTPEGGKIEVRTSTDGHSIIITVTDTGPGIPKEEQEKVFQRFYRVDRARARASGGAGLGLSITKWIIQSHGGKIAVESTPGEGTTFIMAFPVKGGFPASDVGVSEGTAGAGEGDGLIKELKEAISA